MVEIERAVEVAVHAIAANKSRTYPYSVMLTQGVWILADDPSRPKARKTEVFCLDDDPERVLNVIASSNVGWHFVCDVTSQGQDPKARKLKFKGLGYRAMSTEWFFAHDLKDIPEFESDPPARLIRTQEEWLAIPQESSQQRLWSVELRQYCTYNDQKAFGWVHSRPFGEDAWTGDLYVRDADRRSGYGRALMSRLLRDDREAEVRNNILIASTVGARLYPLMGYQELATLQIFCPMKRD